MTAIRNFLVPSRGPAILGNVQVRTFDKSKAPFAIYYQDGLKLDRSHFVFFCGDLIQSQIYSTF